jgi:hypothetical protein
MDSALLCSKAPIPHAAFLKHPHSTNVTQLKLVRLHPTSPSADPDLSNAAILDLSVAMHDLDELYDLGRPCEYCLDEFPSQWTWLDSDVDG